MTSPRTSEPRWSPSPRPHPPLDELVAALPPGAVVVDPDVMEPYRHDRAETVVGGAPLAVVRATTTADVQATMRFASARRIAVVPRGAGTGLSGGASAIDGCIVCTTEQLRSLTIDPAGRLAVAQAGVLNVEVKEAARAHGLWYPPDPSSFETCSIGGNVATNAGGPCCLKYGVTTDYVLALEVVLGDGRALRLGGTTVKDVAGYDLKRLFVGSEGTLGVITEVTLRLHPSPPPVVTLVAGFPDAVAAGEAVAAMMRRCRPAALELMDRTTLEAVERVSRMGLDPAWGALLVARSDAPGPAGVAEAVIMHAACEAAGASYVAVTEDEAEGELFMAARRLAVPAVERLGTVVVEDVCVPVARVPDLLRAVEGVADRYDTRIAVVGHAGDGNLHPLIVFDRHDPHAVRRAEASFGSIMDHALALGGTITGEHGVGNLKAPWLGGQIGEDAMALSRAVKRAIDPFDILNPGKWI